MRSRKCLHRTRVSCIVPPHMLQKLLESKDKAIKDAALKTLLTTANLRGERFVRALTVAAAAPAGGRRTIFDCGNGGLSFARLARTEDGQASTDASVNRAFDGLGVTREFFKQVLDRDSIDGQGMRLNGYVHYSTNYANAFWNGQAMVFGDGDGEVFDDFTKSLDVIAHELGHGVTEYTANLEYHNQPGALNESMSDVFGSLVKQWSKNQQASEADWLIGADIFTPAVEADALRSMKAPGTAYDSPELGRDPQPDHFSRYVNLPDTEQGDWGGVHINSGIPNKAFYLTATAIGGYAWEAAGHIWYESLLASTQLTQFQEFADTTHAKAGQLYSCAEQRVVAAAWRDVGIRVSGVTAAPAPPKTKGGRVSTLKDGEASLEDLTRQIESLAEQLKGVAKDVAALKAHK